MKFNKLALLLIAPLFVFTQCKKSKEEIVSQIVKETIKYKSVHYKAMQKSYYSNQPDTTVTPYEIWEVRNENDTHKNGYIWVDNNYRPYNMIYDKGIFYLAIPPKKTTIVDSDFNDYFISEIDWIDVFLQPAKLQEQINFNLNQTDISDTIYNGESCFRIRIKYPQNKAEEIKTYIYIINKKTFLPLFTGLETKTNDYDYFDALYYWDYNFDQVNMDKLKARQQQVLTDNPTEPEGSDSETSRLERMLHIGEQAPLFEGNIYGSGTDFSLENYIGKNVIIVDFWYTHCPPCVRAMPALSELYSQYESKGLKVFGLNSVDNQPRSLDNLDKFLAKRQLSYEVIMTAPSVDIKYKINGYPTMYVVDKSGKISFVEIGYDKEKFEVFKAHIEHLLKQK